MVGIITQPPPLPLSIKMEKKREPTKDEQLLTSTWMSGVDRGIDSLLSLRRECVDNSPLQVRIDLYLMHLPGQFSKHHHFDAYHGPCMLARIINNTSRYNTEGVIYETMTMNASLHQLHTIQGICETVELLKKLAFTMGYVWDHDYISESEKEYLSISRVNTCLLVYTQALDRCLLGVHNTILDAMNDPGHMWHLKKQVFTHRYDWGDTRLQRPVILTYLMLFREKAEAGLYRMVNNHPTMCQLVGMGKDIQNIIMSEIDMLLEHYDVKNNPPVNEVGSTTPMAVPPRA